MKKALILILLVLTLTLTSCGKKYTVVFDTQGGTPIETVEVKKRDKVDRPSDPTKEGYLFVEWQLDGETFDFDTKIKEDITLVAVWKQTGPTSLDTPTNVVINGNTISWNAVNGATEYEVYIDGVKHTTNTTTLNFDFSKTPLTAVTVIAKSGKVASKQSEPVIYEKTYTSEELYEIFEGKVDMDEIHEYFEAYNTGAQVIKKYNIDIDRLGGEWVDIIQYVKENRPIDLVLAGIIFMQSLIPFAPGFQPMEPTEDLYSEELTHFYNELCQNGLIENTTSDPYEHDKFILFVVPCIMSSSDIGKDSHDNAQELILDILYYGYPNVKIERVENGYLVTRTILNKQMLFTDEELNKINQYFRHLDYDSWLYQNQNEVREAARNYVNSLERYHGMKKIIDENEKISKELLTDITMDKDSLNQIIQDLIDAYEVVLGYEDKIDQLINDFENADSEAKINLLVEDAKNFSEQVADLIKDTLPTQEEIDKLLGLVKHAKTLVLYIDSYMAADFAEYILNIENTITLLDAALNDAVALTNKVLNIVEKLEVEELKTALEFSTNLTTDIPKEVVDLVKKLFSEITKIVGEFEFSSGLFDLSSLEIVNQILISGGSSDAIGVIELLSGLDLSQKEIDLVIAEAYEFIDYILKYDFNSIIDLLVNQEISEEYYTQISTKLDSFVSYIFEYVTVEKIKKYEKYTLSVFEYNGYDQSYYQLILDNFDTLKKMCEINVVTMYIEELGYALSMPYDIHTKTIFYYLKELSDQEVKAMAKAYTDVSIKFNNLDSDYYDEFLNEPFITNFQDSMNKLEKLFGKQEFELTESELDLIKNYEYNYIFNYADWDYPSIVEVILDDWNEQIIFSIKDKYDSQYDFSGSTSHLDFYIVMDDFDVRYTFVYMECYNGDYVVPYQTIYNKIGTDRLSSCVKIYIDYCWFSLDDSSGVSTTLKGVDLTHIIK